MQESSIGDRARSSEGISKKKKVVEVVRLGQMKSKDPTTRQRILAAGKLVASWKRSTELQAESKSLGCSLGQTCSSKELSMDGSMDGRAFPRLGVGVGAS